MFVFLYEQFRRSFVAWPNRVYENFETTVMRELALAYHSPPY